MMVNAVADDTGRNRRTWLSSGSLTQIAITTFGNAFSLLNALSLLMKKMYLISIYISDEVSVIDRDLLGVFDTFRENQAVVSNDGYPLEIVVEKRLEQHWQGLGIGGFGRGIQAGDGPECESSDQVYGDVGEDGCGELRSFLAGGMSEGFAMAKQTRGAYCAQRYQLCTTRVWIQLLLWNSFRRLRRLCFLVSCFLRHFETDSSWIEMVIT